MNPQISPFRQSVSAKTANLPVKQAAPALEPMAIPTALGPNKQRYNPFLSALDSDSAAFKEMYGVNRPLDKPMFLGYRDDQPMYGGSRLFLLY